MSTPCSAVHTSPPKSNRNIANFHSTLWGNYFLNCSSEKKKIDSTTQEQYEKLKQEVRRMITSTPEKPARKLEMIDTIQRLGVAYIYEKEIKDELQKVVRSYDIDNCNDNDDLKTVSLRFRLLREQGIKISCDVFKKFKDNDGKFKTCLIEDTRGMLSLYEAAHLSIHGEDILDEAIDFTTTHLQAALVSQACPDHLADLISHALYRPLRKGLPRLEARYFLSIYPRCDSHNQDLLKFAILDFNLVQAIHRKELSDLTKWCNDLDFVTKLPYTRDRIVELYFWMNGVYFEPQYAFGRRILVKVLYMISIIDDTFDSYGTIEEIRLFTEAVKRWNVSAVDILPEYMKAIYIALLDVYDDIEQELARRGISPSINIYAIKEMQKVVEAYCAEAEWFNKGYVPTLEEYMSVALVSICFILLATVSFLDMGDIATKEAFDWLTNNPKVIKRSSIVSRLMEDKASHKFEQQRGHVASSVECYMNQHGVSEEETIKVFLKDIENGWKDMNEVFVEPHPVSMPLLDRILNLLRSAEVVYREGDSYTNGYLMKDHIVLLFKDPILL